MKARDLLPIVERVRRATTNGDVLTICDALFKRLQHEVATSAKPKSADDAVVRNLSKFVEKSTGQPIGKIKAVVIDPFSSGGQRIENYSPADPMPVNGTPLDPKRKFLTDKPAPGTAMDAVVERAESGRKPPTGKAKRALAKAAARKAARKGAKP